MLDRIAAETGWGSMEVVITGGLSGLVAPELRTRAVHDPDLTVQGLRIIAERCRSGS
jgi:pantothenate kinase type III